MNEMQQLGLLCGILALEQKFREHRQSFIELENSVHELMGYMRPLLLSVHDKEKDNKDLTPKRPHLAQ